MRGKEALHFSLEAATRKGFSLFFRVADRIHSYVEPDSFYTLRYEKFLREGRYRKSLRADYFPSQGIVEYSDGDTVPLTRGALDPLSLFYYLRMQNLKPGDTIKVPYHVDKKNSEVEIVVTGREQVETPLGNFQALVVSPKLPGENIFKGKGGMEIWISEEPPYLLLKIKTEVFFGHLTAEITSYQKNNSSSTPRLRRNGDPGE